MRSGSKVTKDANEHGGNALLIDGYGGKKDWTINGTLSCYIVIK